MRDKIKRLALKTLHFSGSFALARSLTRKNLAVLTYHRVIPDELAGKDRPRNSLFASEFAGQIAYLARRYHIVNGAMFQEFLLGNTTLPANSVLLTFDDGYENNYSVAWPILRRYNGSAVFFVTTDFIDRQGWLWLDELDGWLGNISFHDIFDWLRQHQLACNLTDKYQFRAWLKTLRRLRRGKLLRKLQKDLTRTANTETHTIVTKPMSWDNVREMHAAGMTIGSHTTKHDILATCPEEEVQMELTASRARIEEEIASECWCFSYPNGEANDFHQSDKKAIQKAGYLCAFTQIDGFVSDSFDPYALPRISVPDSGDPLVFRSHVSGVNHRLKVLRAGRAASSVSQSPESALST